MIRRRIAPFLNSKSLCKSVVKQEENWLFSFHARISEQELKCRWIAVSSLLFPLKDRGGENLEVLSTLWEVNSIWSLPLCPLGFSSPVFHHVIWSAKSLLLFWQMCGTVCYRFSPLFNLLEEVAMILKCTFYYGCNFPACLWYVWIFVFIYNPTMHGDIHVIPVWLLSCWKWAPFIQKRWKLAWNISLSPSTWINSNKLVKSSTMGQLNIGKLVISLKSCVSVSLNNKKILPPFFFVVKLMHLLKYV